MGSKEESTFSLAFRGCAVCQRDAPFEAVIEKCSELVVGCEYTGEQKVLQLRIWWRAMEKRKIRDYFGRWTVQGL